MSVSFSAQGNLNEIGDSRLILDLYYFESVGIKYKQLQRITLHFMANFNVDNPKTKSNHSLSVPFFKALSATCRKIREGRQAKGGAHVGKAFEVGFGRIFQST